MDQGRFAAEKVAGRLSQAISSQLEILRYFQLQESIAQLTSGGVETKNSYLTLESAKVLELLKELNAVYKGLSSDA